MANTRNKKGFTLVELIITMVIVGILAGMGVPLVFTLVNSFQYSIDRKGLSESADVALKRMSRDIRRLKDNTSVITANATSYSFIVDIAGNPVTIQFRLNGTNLEREYNGQTDILACDLSAFNCTYLDDAGAAIDTPLVWPQQTDIKFVEIDMTLQSENNAINYRTKIRPRNVVHLADLFS